MPPHIFLLCLFQLTKFSHFCLDWFAAIIIIISISEQILHVPLDLQINLQAITFNFQNEGFKYCQYSEKQDHQGHQSWSSLLVCCGYNVCVHYPPSEY